ncbi:MAG: hypothetical protein JOZ07_04270 [Solirubrobacterales bacterium]|nr:hypothetical protein [Solirubrobacterales bacterium]
MLLSFGAAPNVDIADGLALQPDGKILVAGTSVVNGTEFSVARLNPDGTLDPSFGSGGKALVSFGGGVDEGRAIALQPDGRIILAGVATTPGAPGEFAVARLNPSGTLDPSFGSAGRSLVSFGGDDAQANGLAVAPDGTIVVAGSSTAGGQSQFALERLTAQGDLDPSFGSGGKLLSFGGTSSVANGVALQPDGKIVVAGHSDVGGLPRFALERLDSHGVPDPSFGSGGKTLTCFGGTDDEAEAVALQRDGKIVAVGRSAANNTERFVVERLQGDATTGGGGGGSGGGGSGGGRGGRGTRSVHGSAAGQNFTLSTGAACVAPGAKLGVTLTRSAANTTYGVSAYRYYIDRGIAHRLLVTVHGHHKTVTRYGPNLVTTHDGVVRLPLKRSISHGSHALGLVIRLQARQGHPPRSRTLSLRLGFAVC